LLGAALVVAMSGGAQAQGRVTAYGDSYVNPGWAGMRLGVVSWLPLLDEPVVNHGHSGDVVAQTLKVVRSTRGDAHGDVVVAVGINDVLREGGAGVGRFTTRYDELLTALATARRVAVVLPLPLPDYHLHQPIDHGTADALWSYRRALLRVAAEHPNVRVADALPQWDPSTMLLPDGLHPDAAGRVVIAHAVRVALRG
jgi:lysophospholipase L1-like esterase